ncbi:GNAT family N-acetyltransferase [Acinetobacter terrestris]|uniref:GNAT family N-acetyltransferase n=1 Tax=Acinetobacter terrestris TaxID=2529843 RepID=A0AAW6UYM3_9GAMM|nr:GNAT family N-acetyltransferase [Acinetobacter terrestris]MDK1685022.1 GNAT family N-acetyltransferase [Acinetobacter terrestris]
MNIKSVQFITQEEKNDLLNVIDNFFSEEFRIKRKVARITASADDDYCNRITLNADLFNVGLGQVYVRCGYLNDACEAKREIAIARIYFAKQKNGHGTALLSKLCKVAQKYNYEIISFECPNNNCRAFATRFGFSKCCVISPKNLAVSLEAYENNKNLYLH